MQRVHRAAIAGASQSTPDDSQARARRTTTAQSQSRIQKADLGSTVSHLTTLVANLKVLPPQVASAKQSLEHADRVQIIGDFHRFGGALTQRCQDQKSAATALDQTVLNTIEHLNSQRNFLIGYLDHISATDLAIDRALSHIRNQNPLAPAKKRAIESLICLADTGGFVHSQYGLFSKVINLFSDPHCQLCGVTKSSAAGEVAMESIELPNEISSNSDKVMVCANCMDHLEPFWDIPFQDRRFWVTQVQTLAQLEDSLLVLKEVVVATLGERGTMLDQLLLDSEYLIQLNASLAQAIPRLGRVLISPETRARTLFNPFGVARRQHMPDLSPARAWPGFENRPTKDSIRNEDTP